MTEAKPAPRPLEIPAPIGEPRTDALRKLVAIVDRLRAPDGCPWDQKQTHASLRESLLEEACEVLDAIDADDPQALKEELGDLLFNVIFHAQLATEEETFRMADVIAEVDAKLKRRHPHVFGDAAASSAEDVISIWQSVKETEEKSTRAKASLLDDVPVGFPSLLRAQKLGKKAAKVGFEWNDTEDVIDKIIEELNEFRAELRAGDRAKQREELGDVLFSVVQLGRRLDLDCEDTLRAANAKFYRRFHGMEVDAAAQNRALTSLSYEEWDALWNSQKEKEKG